MAESTNLRWDNYVLDRGDALWAFWSDHLKDERRVLVIMGKGFDPRACDGLRMLTGCCQPTTIIEVFGVDLDEGPDSPSLASLDVVEQNWQRISELVRPFGNVRERKISLLDDNGQRIGSAEAHALFNSGRQLGEYTDIVLDVSSMPRGVYIPVVSALVTAVDAVPERCVNLHIFVSEDPDWDAAIREEGLDEVATFLHPYSGSFGNEDGPNGTRIWVPILGEGRTLQCERIMKLVSPDEVAPGLPSPSRNPRRGDDLLLEYRHLLKKHDVSNIFYVAEDNPFDVYRQVCRVAGHFNRVFALLGGGTMAVSALCGKLMSIGVALAAYDLTQAGFDIALCHLDCSGYSHPPQGSLPMRSQVVGLWIAGECYA